MAALNRLVSLRVADVMSRQVVPVYTHQTMAEAAAVFIEHGISGAPVLDEQGHCVGILSAADFVRRQRGAVRSASSFSACNQTVVRGCRDGPWQVEEVYEDRVTVHMSPAVQTVDGQGISYQLAQNGRKIRNRIDFAAVCDAGKTPDSHLQTAVGHTCDEVLCCYYNNTGCPATTPPFCADEGWDWSYLYPTDLKYSDLDRVEAMLIMMQDMIDVAGHYQWRIPEVLGEE